MDFDISILNNDKIKYTTSKFHWESGLDNVIDLHLENYLKTNELIKFNGTTTMTQRHAFLERMYWNRKNVNTLVPIVKHYECLESEASLLES